MSSTRQPVGRFAAELGTLMGSTVLGLAMSAGLAEWLPRGPTGIDHVVFASLAAPLIIALLCVGLTFAQDRLRAWLLVMVATLILLSPALARWVLV